MNGMRLPYDQALGEQEVEPTLREAGREAGKSCEMSDRLRSAVTLANVQRQQHVPGGFAEHRLAKSLRPLPPQLENMLRALRQGFSIDVD